jgi:hypothetical protein
MDPANGRAASETKLIFDKPETVAPKGRRWVFAWKNCSNTILAITPQINAALHDEALWSSSTLNCGFIVSSQHILDFGDRDELLWSVWSQETIETKYALEISSGYFAYVQCDQNDVSQGSPSHSRLPPSIRTKMNPQALAKSIRNDQWMRELPSAP